MYPSPPSSSPKRPSLHSQPRPYPPASSSTFESPFSRPYRTSSAQFTTRHLSRPSAPLPNIMTLFDSTLSPSFEFSSSNLPLARESQNTNHTPHILSSPQTTPTRPPAHISSTTLSSYTSQMVFFPPFEPSTQKVAMTTTTPHYTYTPMWERPTASPHPNPPRKREKAIGFATNAFNPQGWSVPSTPLASPTSTSNDASFPLPQTAQNIGAPALIHAPIQVKAPHPPRQREEAMAFATNSFDPKGWTLPTAGDSSVSLNSDDVSSAESDDLILSPNDTDLEQSIGQLVPFIKPAGPVRPRTEPIGFAANGWDISLPVIPIQVDTRVQSPISPTSSNVFDWEPVYQPIVPKKAIVSKPCSKWMTKVSTPPKTPSAPPDEVSDVTSTPVDAFTTTGPPAIALRDEEARVSPPTHSHGSTFTLGPAYSARSSSLYNYKHAQGDDQISLTEIDVREALHPNITNAPREPSPEVPPQIVQEVAALKLDVEATPAQTDIASKVSPAEDALKNLWQRHMSLSTTPMGSVHKQVEPKIAAPLKSGDVKGNISPKASPARPNQGRRRQSSALMALRDIYSPEVPHNSPDLNRVLPTLGASIHTGDEYSNHLIDRSSIFDPETLSSKLRKSSQRVDFDELQGLGSPPLGPAEADDFYMTNEADHGGSTSNDASAQSARKWRLGWH